MRSYVARSKGRCYTLAKVNKYVYPVRLQASLHATIWGGHRLERDRWKPLPPSNTIIGESWETEINTVAQNGPYTGKTLGALVEELGVALLGEQAIAIFGHRFPLLAKFLDANNKLSVQVHPDDLYAAQYEGGKLGKTEFWYILAAEHNATIVHGFKVPTTRVQVHEAIRHATLDALLHEETVHAGDVIFVPSGTVHAIGSGILLYELQEYSDITYRMYDYNRLTSVGTPRELHIERSLDVAHYGISPRIKVKPVPLVGGPGHEERCLAACPYFVTRELTLKHKGEGYVEGTTTGSCIILSSLGAEVQVYYGASGAYSEHLSRGQTMLLPAKLGEYRIEGTGRLLLSYVPMPADETWQLWEREN